MWNLLILNFSPVFSSTPTFTFRWSIFDVIGINFFKPSSLLSSPLPLPKNIFWHYGILLKIQIAAEWPWQTMLSFPTPRFFIPRILLKTPSDWKFKNLFNRFGKKKKIRTIAVLLFDSVVCFLYDWFDQFACYFIFEIHKIRNNEKSVEC